jgi:hypothetical protein
MFGGFFMGIPHYTSLKISLPTQRKPPPGGMPGGGKSCFYNLMFCNNVDCALEPNRSNNLKP